MSRQSKKRERLFELYSKNLSIWFPDVANTFVCPVCFRMFGHAALSGTDPHLVLGHLVPRSVLGRRTTLVCKDCESRRSAPLDRAIADEKAYHEFNQGARSLDAVSPGDNGKVTFEMSIQGNRPTLSVISKRSCPEARSRLLTDLASEVGTSFTVQFSTFNYPRRDLAYLYHSFLVMFDFFGYEYAMCRQAKSVREILLQQLKPDLAPILLSIKRARDMPRALPAVNVLIAPQEESCFLVALPPLLPDESARAVLLPGPCDKSAGFFHALLAGKHAKPTSLHLAYVDKQLLFRVDNPDSKGQMTYLFSKYHNHKS